MTPSEQPPARSPHEEEDSLDWSENQSRPRRSLLGIDLGLFVILLIITVLLIGAVVAIFVGRGHH